MLTLLIIFVIFWFENVYKRSYACFLLVYQFNILRV